MRYGMQILRMDEKGILPIVYTKDSWVIIHFPRYRTGTLFLLAKCPSAGYGFKLFKGSDFDIKTATADARNFIRKTEQESIYQAVNFCRHNINDLDFIGGEVIQFFDRSTLMNWLTDHHYLV